MFQTITKRDGRPMPYSLEKVAHAVYLAMKSSGYDDLAESQRIAQIVEGKLVEQYKNTSPGVEDIQDNVETALMENGYAMVSKKYILYRAQRNRVREMNTSLMRIYDEITFTDSTESDIKRDNANIDGDTAMGVMLKYGSEGAKDYYQKFVLTPEQSRLHAEGDIHIHDLEFYTLTTTCCQIDLIKLFQDGFSTGHGHLRAPNDIQSYAALACIAIQSNQNDQHGGQSLPNFDYALAPGVAKTFKRQYRTNLAKALELMAGANPQQVIDKLKELEATTGLVPELEMKAKYLAAQAQCFSEIDPSVLEKAVAFTGENTHKETDRATYQAMEALVHNLNTMHSRAGAQTPFSSINYGTDISPEGRMVIKNVMLATESGLGNGETPIFPIHIFKVKEGVNYNKTDPSYDLFQLACRVSAKRLFPNFSFIDAPFNLQFYKEGKPETEVAYMGCRTRVMANVHDTSRQITYGRGNLSFSSINLPRIAIKARGSTDLFFEELERKLDFVSKQLLDRYAIQAAKRVKNYPFLMGQGIWIDSEHLGYQDTVGEVLKHGTLSIGFIGLAETLTALVGHHHGESIEARNLGMEIVGFMREYTDKMAEKTKMNFSLLATPAEGLSGRFVKIDKKKFGIIPGVTDKDYYTNSFHIPVSYPISAFDKIKVEAPYHSFTNAGHISYVELDGDTANNIEAFESIIRCMKESGMGYGSINHPVDTDPVCGYVGVINDVCPRCGRGEGQGVSQEKLDQLRKKYPNMPVFSGKE